MLCYVLISFVVLIAIIGMFPDIGSEEEKIE